MHAGLLQGGEDTSGLDDVLGSRGGPVDVGRVALAEDCDLGAVHVQEGAVLLHLACKQSLGYELRETQM